MQFGRAYEEFEVGAVYRHWPGKTVTEYDDHLFCLLTMNHHPLHLDSNYAGQSTEFGRNVVVGNYIYSLLLGKWPSTSKTDRGIVAVETRGYKQDGTLVCVFRRKVMVPTRLGVNERGGEQPGRPRPTS
jgi:acyl dehydratase